MSVDDERKGKAITIAVGALRAIADDPKSGAYGQLALQALGRLEPVLGMKLTGPPGEPMTSKGYF
jgi:hypothetical protein